MTIHKLNVNNDYGEIENMLNENLILVVVCLLEVTFWFDMVKSML